MNNFIHADVFFFITTMAVIAVALGFIIALFYLVRILRNIYKVSDKIKEESTEILDDIKNARHSLKKDGLKFRDMVNFFKRFFGKRKLKEKEKDE